MKEPEMRIVGKGNPFCHRLTCSFESIGKRDLKRIGLALYLLEAGQSPAARGSDARNCSQAD
jgi:hypothetical protein